MPEQKKRTNKKRILLIEDDSLLSEMYTMVLEDEGFNVSLAEDGGVAMEKNLKNIDLVLLDIRLPEVDGLKVLKQYRKKGFKKPIIVVTNNPQVNLNEALQLGADSFMVKSHSDIEEIVKTVKQYIQADEQ